MRKVLPFLLLLVFLATSCTEGSGRQQPQSASGVKKADVDIPTNKDGMTVEQQNVKDRLLEDNKPGSIKHLYIISAYSGQVVIYSTVRGKVTSGGKRLTPFNIYTQDNQTLPFEVHFPSGRKYTTEVLQDDGTYGHSMDYLYWWDTKGVYHQHYVSGGQIVHISNQPLAVKSIIINMEMSQRPQD